VWALISIAGRYAEPDIERTMIRPDSQRLLQGAYS